MGMSQMHQDSDETVELLRAVEDGDQRSLDDLFQKHRARLRRMVHLRLAQRLKGRIDASDVIQDAFLEASQRLPKYLDEAEKMPFFLWLRFITSQKLVALHRHHLGVKARDPRREVAIYDGAMPEATTEALAAQLLGQFSSPSLVAVRAERQIRLQEALNTLDPLEREVLALRHFEQLSNAETAQELKIQESAASKRYIRALRKLKGILSHLDMGTIGN